MLFDLFISHATEDKDSVVRPLANRLEAEHLHVWYDEFTLRLGDSLRRSIDLGLAKSRYGIVVLSHSFFAKQWPQRELDGLVARETSGGEHVILPVWHGITKAEICEYSPTLADLVAVPSSDGIDQIVEKILRVVRPVGSPLIVARDRLITFGLSPPVVTDEWWLDVVEASNREYPWGMRPHQETWGYWTFPLPEGEGPFDRGEKLAWTAMQMSWSAEAESRRVCQVTPPEEVLDFIDSQPGLAETCHDFPHFLATYAPQLTMPGFGGAFEPVFDELLERSIHERTGKRGGTALTTDGAPPKCDEYIALHHRSFCGYTPDMLACQFVMGDYAGPPCRFYAIADYAFWFLSEASSWMPDRIRQVLLAGMKDWAQWLWTDKIPASEREMGIEPYPGVGSLAEFLFGLETIQHLELGPAARNDLLQRISITKALLPLPENQEEIANAFLSAGFIEAWLLDERRRRRKANQ